MHGTTKKIRLCLFTALMHREAILISCKMSYGKTSLKSCPVALKFDGRLGSTDVETAVKLYDYLNYPSSGFETLRDLTIDSTSYRTIYDTLGTRASPGLPLRHAAVARILANVSAAFIESCADIG